MGKRWTHAEKALERWQEKHLHAWSYKKFRWFYQISERELALVYQDKSVMFTLDGEPNGFGSHNAIKDLDELGFKRWLH